MKDKEQLAAELEANLQALLHWVEAQDDERFSWKPAADKWSTGQHLIHLIKSTKPLNIAYRLPYFVLGWWQGLNNREERSYDGLVQRYQEKLAKVTVAAPAGFQPEPAKQEDKQQIIAELERQTHRLMKTMRRQNENAMGRYLLPHPLLGRLTLREMLYFTVYHMSHHHRILEEKYA